MARHTPVRAPHLDQSTDRWYARRTLGYVNDLDAVLAAAADHDAAGEPWALATVISVRGSTYRRPGARLLVPETSTPVGLVSGGCLEDEVARLGREALRRKVPVEITIDHSAEGDEVWGSGLGCRGILELIAEPPPLASETVTALRDARVDGTATYLLTRLDGTRRRLEAEQAASLAPGAAEAVRAGRPVRIGQAVLDPILPPPHLVICGAGPDAPALVGVATMLGWRVTVADPRRRLLAAAAVEPALRLDAEPAEVPDRLGAHPASAVVVMSHDYLRDAAFLGAFAGRGAAYLGVLGPRERTARLLDELRSAGTPLSDADRSVLHAPAGLDLGADGPQEVALAIAAEILAALRGAGGGSLRDRGGPIHPPM
jgi:xanthine/CO dehydrogenase XdhC/CoxF family maturation factor